jgi:iron complex outermembrane receptor protein
MRLTVAVLAALAAPLAVAQTAGPNAALDEIVVTARKTAERLQDVPLSITALTAEQMQQRQIRDLADVAALTPGLNFEAYLGGNATPVIRGAAQGRIQDLDQNVSTFFDGIYLPRQYVISPGVVGLERVEIVKGPQSALYGRNAFMGAINYVSKKPGDELQGQIELTAGSSSRKDVVAELSGALLPGKVFMRVGYGRSEFDGDATNYHPKASDGPSRGSPDRLGGWTNEAMQARLVIRPIDTVELDLGYYHFDVFQETPPIVRYQLSTNDMNCGQRLANGRLPLYCGELDYRFRPLPGGGPNEETVVDPRGYGLDMSSNLVRGHAEWKATDKLNFIYEYGHLTAEAIGGGSSDRDPVLGSINIFAPAAPRGNQFQVSPAGDLNYVSNEVRVQFRPIAGLDLMLGYFDSTLHDYDYFPLNAGLPLLGTAPYDVTGPGWFILSRGRTTVDASAIFGSVAWQIDDRWRVGLEARQAKEEKTLVSGPSSFSAAVRTLNGDWSQFTPRGTVDFRLTPESLLYFSAAKGAKSGGFNLSAIVPAQFEFQPDENWTYEIGSKNTFLGGRLRLNGAIFYVDWKNQQVSCSAAGSPINITPPAVICNLGKAKIEGAEADAAWVPIDGLTLTAAVSYNDATYGNGVIDQRIRDFKFCDDVVCPRSGDIGGNQLMRQSKFQWQLGADYDFPLGDTLRGFVGGDAGYKSKQYADTMNLAYLPSRTLANVRAGVRTERFDVTAWVKNVTNEHYGSNAFAIFAATDVNYTPIQGPHRTWGVTGRYSFGGGR